MSDLAGVLLGLKSPRTDADTPMLFDLVKVAAEHGVHVFHDTYLVQALARDMVAVPFGDDAIEFGISASPLESTSENLINLSYLDGEGEARDARLRGRLNDIRAILAAAFASGRVATALIAFSDANATESDPCAQETTDLSGFVETCMRYFSAVDFQPGLRVWVEPSAEKVYVLQHVQADDEFAANATLIGVYRSEQAAAAAVERLRADPGS